MSHQSEEKKTLKNFKENGNINNLTYQYYNTVHQLANIKAMKAQQQNSLTVDLDVTTKSSGRKIKVSRRGHDIAGNSTSLKHVDTIEPQIRLLPPVKIEPNTADTNHDEYIQLPSNLISKKSIYSHKIVNDETHLLTPGKAPKIKVVSSKNGTKHKITKNKNKIALKERDMNTLKKNINMRDMLSVKTRYDVSPGNKGDFLAELKPISKAFTSKYPHET
ncbi:hypothetical protein ACO0R3_000967 [Hanseniaspora guilliermondii]